MRLGALACALGVLAAAAGCGLLGNKPAVVPSGSLVFPVERLDRLDLGSVEGVFAPNEDVSVEAFNPAVDDEEGFTGGLYVFGTDGSITVRLYGSDAGAAEALLRIMRIAREKFATGAPTARFPREWWYRQGPPATILFAYGNAVVLIRAATLAPARIPLDGLEAAAAVAAQLAAAAAD